MSALLDWLFGSLQRRPASTRAPLRRPPPTPPASHPPEDGSDLASFAPFARALRVLDPGTPAEDPVEDPEIETWALDVLQHFRENRLGPASAPSLALRVLNLIASPNPDLKQLLNLVGSDIALAGSLLQVANSSLFVGTRPAETVRDAVTRLGFDEVARVAGGASAKSLFHPQLRRELAAFAPTFNALYRRSLTIAWGAAGLALHHAGARSDRAYAGGLLHDVGNSIALRSVAALHLGGWLPIDPCHPKLDRLLDRVHVEIGAETHQEWSVPQYLTVLCVRHHDREVPADPELVELHLVRLAAAVYDLKLETTPVVRAQRAAVELVQSANALRVTPFQIRALGTDLGAAAQKVREGFGL